MHGVTGGAQRHGFVVLTLENFDLCARAQAKIFQKTQKTFILLIDAQNLRGFVGAKVGKKDAALLAELRNTAIDGDAVRTGFTISKALEQQCLDLRRYCVLHAFGFGVGFGPGKADDLSKQHFGKLVAKHEPLGKFAPLRGQQNVSATLYRDVPIAGHAFNGGSDSGRGNVKLFGEAGADGDLLFLQHFPNGFEVIFLRDASFVAAQ